MFVRSGTHWKEYRPRLQSNTTEIIAIHLGAMLCRVLGGEAALTSYTHPVQENGNSRYLKSLSLRAPLY